VFVQKPGNMDKAVKQFGESEMITVRGVLKITNVKPILTKTAL
jgi:hypothetical protein